MDKHASVIFNTQAILGEGAIWDHTRETLYWVDIEGRTFNIFDPATKKNTAYNTFERVGTVVPAGNDKVLLALQDGFAFMALADGSLSYLLHTSIHHQQKRFNDGKCDPQGRFWVGSLTVGDATPDNKFYCFTPDAGLTEHLAGLTISNGIAWSADSSLIYHIDTPIGEVSQYDFDKNTGQLSNKRVIIKVPPEEGYPDGMTIDSEGNIWIALWDGFCVACYNPITGKQIKKIEVPAPKVTSCAFGGKNLDELFITTASAEMTDEELQTYPLSGSLFVAKTDVTGCKSFSFGH